MLVASRGYKSSGFPRGIAPKKMGGFTFIGLMVIITIMGIGLLSVGEVWHVAQKREKEQQLLFIGDQFRLAIKLFKNHTPPTNRLQIYPNALEDLVKDPRYPSTQRYLRKIYPDPLTGKSEWGVVKTPNGGIYGVYSLSEEIPIKQNNFRPVDQNFEGKTKYSDWVFLPASAPVATNPVAGNPAAH